jgi:tetratricopeptide (TPR) repeat protein
MAKSMVERYEQLLLQDPTSAVFVELAKVLLEKGDPTRAIEVCQQGLSHHASSVIGRVLWGKALLHLGKPAEAMEQFDQAVAIDKENAHAYNLIGEVLVQRGLFRSALPILRRAAALQPNDGRVKLWLEQTQQALSGGPPPVLADLPGLTANALAPQPLAEEPPPAQEPPAQEPPARNPFDAADEDEEEPRDITKIIRVPVLQETPIDDSAREQAAASPAPPASGAPAPQGGTPRAHVYMFPAHRPPAPPPQEDDLADTPPPFGGEEPDLEDTPRPSFAPARQARSEDEEAPGLLSDVEPPTRPGPASDDEAAASQGLLPDVDAPAGEDEAERDGSSEEELSTEPAARPASSGGGLLGDLPLPDDEEGLPALPAAARVSETARKAAPGRSRTATPASGSKRALLDDIPDEAAAAAPAAASRKNSSSQVDAAAIAAAYEKELREKLAKKAETPSFFSRYGLKLVVVGVPVLLALVGTVVYLVQKAAHGGQNLIQVLDRTEKVISQDTRASLREALSLIELAHDMDEGSSRAWALKAYAHALLYVDHGSSADDRKLALAALEQPGVRSEHVGLSLATDVLVADDKARATAHRALLESIVEDSAELHTLAGSLLLEQKQPEKALERFKKALAASPRNARVLAALGHYYQDNEDLPNALKMYAGAREFSPDHPRVRIGMAETRLELGEELEAALTDMQALGGDAELSEPLRARQQLAQGRLLAQLGRYDEALGLLASGTKGPLAFHFYLALGDASRAAGKLPEAQQAYEAALKLEAKSEPAREGLARALLDRDRVKDALARLDGDGSRKASLVRAAAYARLEEWKRVRSELERTRVNNRFPPEAIGYLAMADTMEGQGEQARDALEKALRGVKQPRTDLQVALGRVHWRLRSLDKAQTSFEEAMKDPRDYEAPCAMGRLLLSRGVPDLALKPLTLAVERNGFHGEARDALGRALLALGRTEEGFKQFETWKNDNPESAEALKGFALALFHSGRHKEAQEVVNKVVKAAPGDAEAHRLRALVLFSTGDSKAAFTALERSFKIDPRDPETLCEIAQGYLRQDKMEDAAAVFEKVRTESPDTTCGKVGEHYADPSEGGRSAAKALQSIAEKAPTVWDKAFAHTAHARVLHSIGGGALKEARAAAEEAVKLAPHSGRTHLALGLVALKQRQEEPALAALTKAVELEPTHGMARLALADLLSRGKKEEDLPRAIQEYEAFLKLAGSSEEAKRVRKDLPKLKRRVK